MKKTLKKEQVDFLKLERQLLGLGAGFAALSAGAAASAEKIVGDAANAHMANMTEAYLNLVEKVQAAHDAMESGAAAVGAQLLEARGTPKVSVLEAAKSILGIG